MSRARPRRHSAASLLAFGLTAAWCLVGIGLPAAAQSQTPGPPAAEPSPTPPGPAADAAPARLGTARGPQAELGSEFWTLSARFETGELLVVEVCITNVGVGDGNAAVLGHWVEADGRVVAFDSAKSAGRWTLSPDRRRLEIGKLALDLGGETRRLEVWKERVSLELELAGAPDEIAIDAMTGADHGFELLGLATPVSGSVQLRGGERRALRGHATLTHRWAERLESRITGRRIELVAAQGELQAYLVDSLSPTGASLSWLVVREMGQIRYSGPVALRADLGPEAAPAGFPLPRALILEGPAVHGRVEVPAPILRFDPLQDLPALVRLVVAPFLRWRSSWSTSPFALDFRDRPGGPLSLRGQGLVNVTYFDAVPVAAAPTGADCRTACAEAHADCPAGCP